MPEPISVGASMLSRVANLSEGQRKRWPYQNWCSPMSRSGYWMRLSALSIRRDYRH